MYFSCTVDILWLQVYLYLHTHTHTHTKKKKGGGYNIFCTCFRKHLNFRDISCASPCQNAQFIHMIVFFPVFLLFLGVIDILKIPLCLSLFCICSKGSVNQHFPSVSVKVWNWQVKLEAGLTRSWTDNEINTTLLQFIHSLGKSLKSKLSSCCFEVNIMVVTFSKWTVMKNSDPFSWWWGI